ncbi:enhancer of rudimentary homolog [Harmonia axyridis]|uniref:enhancer of rudimentary homolog n=1 Tax=Harmonia axyridis TaxID=115357 RepID=UPI001E279C65|nr:enhancer of rudimentary homolog [Harmonia axyridis]
MVFPKYNLQIMDSKELKTAHTILLIQPTSEPESRTFSDYESVKKCMEDICEMYEEHLRKQKPEAQSIIYKISEVIEFTDELSDIRCLVFHKSTNTYAPYNREWIKERINNLYRKSDYP